MVVSPFLFLPKCMIGWCEEWQGGELNGNYREETEFLLLLPTNSPLSPAHIQANGEIKAEDSKDQSETMGSSQVFQWETILFSYILIITVDKIQ